MAAVAAEFEGRVNFLGVAGRDGVDAMARFIDDTGVGGIPHIADESGEIWVDFGVSAQPAWAFIDDDGTVQVALGRLGEASLREVAEQLEAS